MYITDEDNPRLPFLRDKTSKLTTSPGCYIMKDKMKKIISLTITVILLLSTLFSFVSFANAELETVSGSPAKGVENGVPRL